MGKSTRNVYLQTSRMLAFFIAVFTLIFAGTFQVHAEMKKGTVTHAQSKLTIISDKFEVGNISTEQDSNFYIEWAQIKTGSRTLGFIKMQNLARINFCGFRSTAKFDILAPGSGLEKYSLKQGGPAFDGERKGKRTKNNKFISYREGEGETFFCVSSAQVTGGNGCGDGGGSELTTVFLCLPKDHADASTLTEDTLEMIHNLRTDGTGKDLIK